MEKFEERIDPEKVLKALGEICLFARYTILRRCSIEIEVLFRDVWLVPSRGIHGVQHDLVLRRLPDDAARFHQREAPVRLRRESLSVTANDWVVI